MTDTQITKLLKEIRDEQHITPFEKDTTIMGYIKEAEFDINKAAGFEIDYGIDLKARSLLKNYVFYAREKKLAEFKELYGAEYVSLQAEYYKPTNV